jgi:1-acyl-sn-glycerol-3-phosphate acyltransferase
MFFYYLGTVIFWFFFILTMVVNFFISLILWVLTRPCDPRGVLLHRFACFWSALYTWFNPFLTLEIEGREKLEKGRTYVICSNHRSIMDIVILYRLFFHYKWVSKKEIFRVPFLGWNMFLNNYVYLDRDKPSSQLKMLKDGESHLKQGSSLIIFPEGTRSRDGHSVGKFRDGAFLMARKAQCDVIPVAVTGTEDVFTKDIVFRRIYPMKITVLDPIPWNFGNSVKELGAETRRRVEEQVKKQEERDQ